MLFIYLFGIKENVQNIYVVESTVNLNFCTQVSRITTVAMLSIVTNTGGVLCESKLSSMTNLPCRLSEPVLVHQIPDHEAEWSRADSGPHPAQPIEQLTSASMLDCCHALPCPVLKLCNLSRTFQLRKCINY